MKELNNLQQTVNNLNHYIDNWDIHMIIHYAQELNRLGYIDKYEVEWLVQDIINDRCKFSYKTFL